MTTPAEKTRLAEQEQRIAMMVTQFRQHRYVVAPHVLNPQSAVLATSYALLQQHFPDYYELEKHFGAAVGRYADAFSETLLLQLQPLVEQVTGLKLLPCYSYLRIYGKGAELQKHLDRPSCEISTSLTLGFSAPGLWPLWVAAEGEDKPISLAPGDMLVYRGANRFRGNSGCRHSCTTLMRMANIPTSNLTAANASVRLISTACSENSSAPPVSADMISKSRCSLMRPVPVAVASCSVTVTVLRVIPVSDRQRDVDPVPMRHARVPVPRGNQRALAAMQ